MANYPAYAVSLESVPELESGVGDDVSQSGIQHSRIFHGKQYYRFAITHPNVSQADYDTLLALYAAGPRDTYTYSHYTTSPLTTFSVKFTQPPMQTVNHGGGRFQVQSFLRGFKD